MLAYSLNYFIGLIKQIKYQNYSINLLTSKFYYHGKFIVHNCHHPRDSLGNWIFRISCRWYHPFTSGNRRHRIYRSYGIWKAYALKCNYKLKNFAMAKKNVILGIIAGAAAGAVAGILLAPGKGSKTRENLSKKGRDAVSNLKGKVNDLVGTASDKFLSEMKGSHNDPFRDSGLERTRSTASHISPGAPSSSNSFT